MKIKICTNSEFDQLDILPDHRINCLFWHKTREEYFEHKTNSLIFATGYKNIIPEFIDQLRKKINWQGNNYHAADANYKLNRNYSINDDNTIFVQNADLHSHGFNSADLGMGPYRNSIILNAILKKGIFTR